MGITAMTGPLVVYGQGTPPTDYNSQAAPNLFLQNYGLLDPRPPATYQPGQSESSYVAGWIAGTPFITVDFAPAVLAVANIAAVQAPAGAGNLTLVSVTGAGITVGQSVSRMDNNQLASNLLAIDGGGGRISYGSIGTVQIWDPAKSAGRVLRYTTTTASNITFTALGFDAYGQPITETAVANANTVAGKKAFKYVQSVAVSAACTGASVGTGDVFGFPLRSDVFAGPYLTIYWNNALISASTGYLAGDQTTPSATTGDPRGTYAVQSASDGSKRLIVTQMVPPANLATVAGLLGATHYATF